MKSFALVALCAATAVVAVPIDNGITAATATATTATTATSKVTSIVAATTTANAHVEDVVEPLPAVIGNSEGFQRDDSSAPNQDLLDVSLSVKADEAVVEKIQEKVDDIVDVIEADDSDSTETTVKKANEAPGPAPALAQNQPADLVQTKTRKRDKALLALKALVHVIGSLGGVFTSAALNSIVANAIGIPGLTVPVGVNMAPSNSLVVGRNPAAGAQGNNLQLTRARPAAVKPVTGSVGSNGQP